MTCLKDNFVNVTAADASSPSVGDGFFYLVRESLTRTFDESPFWPTRSQSGTRTPEISTAPGTCP
jgi:hypothetical protein